MGIVFGKIDVETPKYEVVQSVSSSSSDQEYEIRKYNPCVVAQVTYDPSQFGGNRDGGFMVLANYIGALGGQPQNTKPEKIAMTAPVITTTATRPAAPPPPAQPIATTSNDAEKKKTNDDDHHDDKEMIKEDRVNKMVMTMQFVLPSNYTKAEDAPTPVDERVVISELGERKYAVVKFSGTATGTVVEERVEKLKKSLLNEEDGHYKQLVTTGGDQVLLARYNPPWTLPIFRTNEIMIPIETIE